MTASENQIVVYQPNETVRLEVRLENETVWLNQSKLGELFGVDRTVVNRHIHNIYKTGELDESATCAKIAQVQNEGDEPDVIKILCIPRPYNQILTLDCMHLAINRGLVTGNRLGIIYAV